MAKKKQKFRKVRVTLVRSPIGRNPRQRQTARSLGLRKPNTSVVHTETPQVRGMIDSISHLLRVEEVEDE